MKLALVLTLLASCAGPDQILTECTDEPISGQWRELGDLRDRVAAAFRDPGGEGIVIYWCPVNVMQPGIPDWHTGGLYLGCGELYAYADDQALRRVRHEAAHCFADRLFGNPEPGHGNGRREHAEFWAVVE